MPLYYKGKHLKHDLITLCKARGIDSSGACADPVKRLEEADSETHADFSDDDNYEEESEDDKPSDIEE